MPSKHQLHQLVDRLPDSEVQTALHVLAALNADPALRAALAAPDDDEPNARTRKPAPLAPAAKASPTR
jgi:hypothetical protein